ncbi:MAG: hypothetical protein AABY64_00105 [Bdellovibrionota bacterium]
MQRTLIIYTCKLKKPIALLIAAITLFGCGKVYTSSTNDLNVYGSGVTGTSVFLNARAVLAVNCMNCHSNWGAYTQQDYIDKFLVIRASPADSIVYSRLRGNDIGIAGDMPAGGRPNLTSEEMKKIKDWISSI